MMRDLAGHPELCAINTATLGFQTSIAETIEAIAKAGFGGIAPWRREVEGQDVKVIARHIRDAGLKVTGYCRSTYLTAHTRAEFQASIVDNFKAIGDAATLGADSYTIVSGTLPSGSKDIVSARAQVAEGVAMLCEYAKPLSVNIAVEPLHPVYANDRSCINLLSQALDLCDAIGAPNIGVCIDAYHTWWDPHLARDIARAGKLKRIFGYHVSDWLSPTTDVLNDRGMMGDGVIDLKSIRAVIEAAGYSGLIEAEIFSTANWWKKPIAETLLVLKERFASAV
jgi:sugar phosphate isomerase/epimerase